MNKCKVCILRTAGTNCDKETAFAFEKVGAHTEFVHVNSLINKADSLDNYHVLALPGGFSYGDDIAAGKVLANELRNKLADDLKRFIEAGKLIIGICNGFQILVKAGLLPGNPEFSQEVSLIINDSGKFEDRWTYLRTEKCEAKRSLPEGDLQLKTNKCVWAKGLPEIIYLPVAHGEGKFVVKDKAVLERLKKNNQVIFRYSDKGGSSPDYPDNPNGSLDDIAGICDDTGRILGLMPHPERHIASTQHPRWENNAKGGEGDGLRIFRNAVEYVTNSLSSKICPLSRDSNQILRRPRRMP
jgi:phosphoribosylformylglycinamidine synthase I